MKKINLVTCLMLVLNCTHGMQSNFQNPSREMPRAQCVGYVHVLMPLDQALRLPYKYTPLHSPCIICCDNKFVLSIDPYIWENNDNKVKISIYTNNYGYVFDFKINNDIMIDDALANMIYCELFSSFDMSKEELFGDDPQTQISKSLSEILINNGLAYYGCLRGSNIVHDKQTVATRKRILNAYNLDPQKGVQEKYAMFQTEVCEALKLERAQSSQQQSRPQRPKLQNKALPRPSQS